MPERSNWWRDRRSSSRSSSSKSSSSRSDRERYSRSRGKRRSSSRKRWNSQRSRSPRREKPEKSDHKSRICIHWERGLCTKGEQCNYAHGAHELSAVQAGTWKTVLCNRFEKGTCTRGSNCSFAHGEEELRDNYKTILCKYYESGNCKSGDKCKFAHGLKELVKLDPPKIEVKVEKMPDKELPKAGPESTPEKVEGKVKEPGGTKNIPCRYWQNGFCNKGENCQFSHEGPQKERPQKEQPQTQGSFKTMLCRYFQNHGQCSKGDSCSFAHGPEELQGNGTVPQEAQPAAPAFKTVLCKYFELGHCTRGDECTYAHGIEELQTREAGTYKTVLCKFFEAGSCSRGASCTFAHGDEDLLSEVPAAAAAGAAAGGSACAVAATAWPMTSLADAIAQSTGSPKDAGLETTGAPVGVLVQPTRLLSKRQRELNAEAQKRVKVTPMTTATTATTATTVTPVEVKPRRQVKRCAFYAVGRCAKGDECSYLHDSQAEELSPSLGRAKVVASAPTESAPTPVPRKLVLPVMPVTVPPRELPTPEAAADVEVEVEVETPANWTDISPPVFKTALCKFFEQGNCTNGDSCTYAHGVEELQPLYKAKLCNFFLQGVCTRGANCTFAHGIEELQGDGSAVNAVPQEVQHAVPAEPAEPAAPAVPAVPLKTVPCKYFALGHCTKGADCPFAHGIEQLREAGMYKTALCKFFEVGNCARGASCTFAHGEEELLSEQAIANASQDPANPAPGNPVPAVPAAFSATVAETVPAAQLFKTAICKFWRDTGTCIHGENCSFAHGEEERQPLYKAKLCNYFQQGHCARGANCTFAHGVEELQDGTSPPPSVAPTTVAADSGVSSVAVPYKLTICKFWERGACLAGDSCTYAHGAEELQPPKEPALYKTALCTFYEQGLCTKGENCTYAHGIEELQAMPTASQDLPNPVPTNPVSALPAAFSTPLAADSGVSSVAAPYKLTICKFWERGACLAGDSCTYAHGAEELQPSQEVKVAARPSVRPSVAPSMAPSMAPSAKAAPKLVPPKGPWETVDVESDWETQRWKTQLCKFFAMGTCQKGENCSYAHGSDELEMSISMGRGGTVFASGPIRVKVEDTN